MDSESAGELDRAKADFVDFVAHELKQPMTAIQGYARMLTMGIGGPLTETQSQFVDVINNNVDRMSKLVSDLLEISRLESGRTQLRVDKVQIQEVIEDTLDKTRREIDARHHTLEVDVPEDLPAIAADRTRLIQILTNLVSNAYRYTPEGGTIHIMAYFCNRADEPAGHVRVSVTDTGIGMSEQELAKLEEPFFRAEHDLVQQQPGTGLGVSIARNLVALHGSSLTIESERGRGSRFSFTMPVAFPTSEPRLQPTSAG